jgi:hypothetical protein
MKINKTTHDFDEIRLKEIFSQSEFYKECVNEDLKVKYSQKPLFYADFTILNINIRIISNHTQILCYFIQCFPIYRKCQVSSFEQVSLLFFEENDRCRKINVPISARQLFNNDAMEGKLLIYTIKDVFVVHFFTNNSFFAAQLLKDNINTLGIYNALASYKNQTDLFKIILRDNFYQPLLKRLKEKGIISLHGSAVCKDNNVVLFTGLSGSGKSTLAAFFARNGYDLIADDTILINTKNMTILPFADYLCNIKNQYDSSFVEVESFKDTLRKYKPCLIISPLISRNIKTEIYNIDNEKLLLQMRTQSQMNRLSIYSMLAFADLQNFEYQKMNNAINLEENMNLKLIEMCDNYEIILGKNITQANSFVLDRINGLLHRKDLSLNKSKK